MKLRQILFVIVVSAACWAQGIKPQPAPTNLPGSEYPLINSDSSVVFRVQAPQANKVQVLLNFGQAAYDMTKGADGYWEVTTKPLAPGFHYYGISVDGFPANDPGSRVFFASGKEINGLDVPGPDWDVYAIRNVPHGAVRTMWYFSKATGDTRRIFVYTPPGYDQNTSRYPVLYLQHGYGEDDAGWTNQGRENFILDNLIAAKKIKPMIVVNENGLIGVHYEMPRPQRPGTAPAVSPARSVARFFMAERYATFDKIISDDLIPFIDSNFRTVADRDHRALAGLSMGGAQALRIGLKHSDQFAYIGAFSPAIEITNLKEDYDGALSDPAKVNKQFRLLWIGIGREDFLFAPVKESHDLLEKAGIKHTWVESSGAHIWTVWRKYLIDFAPKLFD